MWKNAEAQIFILLNAQTTGKEKVPSHHIPRSSIGLRAEPTLTVGPQMLLIINLKVGCYYCLSLPAAGYHRPQASTKLYERHTCE